MKETHARLHSNDKLKPKMDFFEPHYFFIIHIQMNLPDKCFPIFHFKEQSSFPGLYSLME